MSNTFNINRFGKILKHDGLNFFPNMILTLAILWAIPVVIWLSNSLTPTESIIDPDFRVGIISVLALIIILLVPGRLYKHCNDPRKGIVFAMLPATSFEKFFSMVFYCLIVTPLIYLAGAFIIDTILALMGGTFEGYAITKAFWWSPLFRKSTYPVLTAITFAFIPVTTSSIFMFGNMVFKKRKTGKMIGILILIHIIFSIIFTNVAFIYPDLIEFFTDLNYEIGWKYILNIALYSQIIVSALLLWGTYRKIKTQKY
ncbi:MAG: hypothetical protein IK004_06975 [Bacteroidales bacterium]|nr:hypothetical protein [Bacteroidales bacterium]